MSLRKAWPTSFSGQNNKKFLLLFLIAIPPLLILAFIGWMISIFFNFQ